jgi:hypothetical protein
VMVMACPICGTVPATMDASLGFTLVHCPRCGQWVLGAIAAQLGISLLNGKLGDWDRPSTHRRSRLSHLIRRQQPASGGAVRIPLDKLETWRLEDPLPSPSEQLDQLVLLVGDDQPSPVASSRFCFSMDRNRDHAAITERCVSWLVNQPAAELMIELLGDGMLLTMPGWERYHALKRAEIVSRTAFMAMKFGDEELNHVIDHCFRPAVTRAGFELRVLTDSQPAGSIDDQLRVALRLSRFVIADLTHGSHGAYWEAGFGEGLGRPVIYTCRNKEWDEKKTHFDTNHLVTIIWEPDKFDEAGTRLTATIRATLPGEARMSD